MYFILFLQRRKKFSLSVLIKHYVDILLLKHYVNILPFKKNCWKVITSGKSIPYWLGFQSYSFSASRTASGKHLRGWSQREVLLLVSRGFTSSSRLKSDNFKGLREPGLRILVWGWASLESIWTKRHCYGLSWIVFP